MTRLVLPTLGACPLFPGTPKIPVLTHHQALIGGSLLHAVRHPSPQSKTWPVEAFHRGFLPMMIGLLVVLLSIAFPAQAISQDIAPPPQGTTGPEPSPIRNNTVDGGQLSAGLDREGQGTTVPVATSLTRLLQDGGEPASIEELHALEAQQQRVAEAAADCTVSVKIGVAQGCGVIISESGYVLTAAHVAMRPGMAAEIFLSNGRRVQAISLGMNRNVDAGLMKINPNQNGDRPWPHASLGSSKDLEPGMWCVATGHPGGYDQQRGPVTRVGRILAVRDLAIVTDCALIGGDSGGPLFDLSGRLIAVHSRIGNDVADNLHVPIDHYADSWERMQQSVAWGYLPGFKPVLGVRGSSSAPQAIIEVVKAGSPADQAGLQSGDIVEEFGDKLITDFKSLQNAVDDTMPGERVRLLVNREGKTRILMVEIGRAGE